MALKVQLKIFKILPTAPPSAPKTYAEVAWAQSRANHVQQIGCLSHATCHVPCGTKEQLSYYVRQSWNRIYF